MDFFLAVCLELLPDVVLCCFLSDERRLFFTPFGLECMHWVLSANPFEYLSLGMVNELDGGQTRSWVWSHKILSLFEFLDCSEELVNAVCFGLMKTVKGQEISHKPCKLFVLLHSAGIVVEDASKCIFQMKIRWWSKQSLFECLTPRESCSQQRKSNGFIVALSPLSSLVGADGGIGMSIGSVCLQSCGCLNLNCSVVSTR